MNLISPREGPSILELGRMDELHVTPRTTSILASKKHKQLGHFPILPTSQNSLWSSNTAMEKHSFHIFTIFHHTFPWSCYVLSMNGWLDFAEVLIHSPSSTSISTSNVPLRIFHVQRHILWYLVMFKIFQNPNGSKNGTFAKPWHNWVVSEILFAAFNTFGGWFGLNPSNDPAPVSNTVEVIWDYPLGPFTTNRVSPYTTECERDVATWLDMGKSPVKPEKNHQAASSPQNSHDSAIPARPSISIVFSRP